MVEKSFNAEVGRLLDIVANALYSDKDIFLRELISNSGDACEKRRYLAQQDTSLVNTGNFAITLAPHKKNKTLTISDNGVGMSKQELEENLGTIARSGTAKFLESKEELKKSDLIGQFGVGFYAAFMVADKVEVRSLKVGEKQAHIWTSTGIESYDVSTTDDIKEPGTSITLYLKKEAKEYLEKARLTNIVTKYSNYLPIEIYFDDGKEEKELLNKAEAIWRKNKSAVTQEDYKNFYQAVSHQFDEPYETIHHQTEGALSYQALLYIPTRAPHDLYNPERKTRLSLYVKRVFITENCEKLVPSWLRFVYGVVESEDLPLNISRELLQDTPHFQKIRQSLTKKIISNLAKVNTKDRAKYIPFWEQFGPALKEGLYEEFTPPKGLADTMLFNYNLGDELISFAEYVEKMKENQPNIYIITGKNLETLKQSAQLEAFNKYQIPVLLLCDAVDEFWPMRFNKYDEKDIVAITRQKVDLDWLEGKKDDEQEKNEETDKDIDNFIAKLKEALSDKASDVRLTDRLTTSPVCLVAEDGGMDLQFIRMMKMQGQEMPEQKPILELNKDHALIKKMQQNVTDSDIELLFDMALIMEGEQPHNAKSFADCLTQLMMR